MRHPLPGRFPATILALALLSIPALAEDSPQDLKTEARRWLRQYLRIDTSNPPGGEAAAAQLLASILHRDGVATQIFVSPQGRANLWARLDAEDPNAETVVLLHHMDVVGTGEGWAHDPFAAEVRGGRVWGRGAIDAKSLGVVHLAAFLDAKRSGRPLRRNLVFLATSDEEGGGSQGVGWLVEAHPELFSGIAGVLNEGGSNRVVANRHLWWGVEVAQKRPLWVRLSTRGRGGHGSAYNPASATHQLLTGLAAFLARPREARVTEAARDYFAAIAGFHSDAFREVFAHEDLTTVEQRFDAMMLHDGGASILLPGMIAYFRDTVQVTSLQTPSATVNVVPEEADALIDMRLLPDTDTEALLAELRQSVGNNTTVEVLLRSAPTRPSSRDNAVYRALETALADEAPLVPSLITGTTDSRYLRERGIPAYGFSPFVLTGEEARGIHGPDESMPLAKFDQGLGFMRRVVRAAVEGPASAELP